MLYLGHSAGFRRVLLTGYTPRLNAFVALTRNLIGAETEFGSLFRSSLTLGIKCFAFWAACCAS